MKEALCYQGLAWRSTSLNHHQPITLCKQTLLFLLWNEWRLCLVLVCCRGDLWRLLTHLTSSDGHKKPMSLRNGTRMQETHQTQRNAIHAQGASSIQVSEAGIPPLRAQTGHRERHDPQLHRSMAPCPSFLAIQIFPVKVSDRLDHLTLMSDQHKKLETKHEWLCVSRQQFSA